MHGATCPLALGFFDRLPSARVEWVSCNEGGASAVTVVARNHRICPYYFARDLVRWADVVVADYNYYFDSSASLYGAMIDSEWRVGVLVDEALNLIDRARSMYSATLQLAQLKALRHEAPALKRTWARMIRNWRELRLPDGSTYQLLDRPPASFLKALQTSSTEVGTYLVENAGAPAQVRDFYLAALHLLRRAELFDDNSVFDISRSAMRKPTSDTDRKSTRLNSSHPQQSRMPSSA